MRHKRDDQRSMPARHTAQAKAGRLPNCSPPPSPRAVWASTYHAMVEEGRGMERRGLRADLLPPEGDR